VIRSLILRAYSAPLDFEPDNQRHWVQLEGLKVAVLTLAPETSGTAGPVGVEVGFFDDSSPQG
jgi:hypothetical protein